MIFGVSKNFAVLLRSEYLLKQKHWKIFVAVTQKRRYVKGYLTDKLGFVFCQYIVHVYWFGRIGQTLKNSLDSQSFPPFWIVFITVLNQSIDSLSFIFNQMLFSCPYCVVANL